MSIIEVRGLTKTFRTVSLRARRVVALRGVDLTIEPGEVYGFLGPNGAGKSTTIKILVGLILASEGTVRVLGGDPRSALRSGRLGYLPENPSLYPFLSGRELLRHFGRLHGLRGPSLERRIDEVLEQVALSKAAEQRVGGYSKGMVQRLALARTVLPDPEVLILDEPMSGLDPLGRQRVRDLVLELARRGRTLFFSSHVIPDVESVSSRVGIVSDGRLLREATVDALMSGAESAYEVVLRAPDLEADALSRIVPQAKVQSIPGIGMLRIEMETGASAMDAIPELRAAGAEVLRIVPIRQELEAVVLEVIERGDSPGRGEGDGQTDA